MRSRKPRSVIKNTHHLLKLSEINYFGRWVSLKACSVNNLNISDFNPTNTSWLFPLRGRGLGRGFNPSSFLTQSLTNNSIDPTPENLSFASHGESQLDFLPSPSRGEGDVTQANLGHSLSLQERYRLLLKLCSLPQHPFSGRDVTLVTERERVRCLPVRANILQANLTPSLGGGERVLLALSGRFLC